MAIAKVDLQIQGLPEESEPAPNEENPGAFIAFNGDDDDGNGVSDRIQTGTILNENDLAPLTISLEPGAIKVGTLRLESTAGGDKIKVWENATKGTEVTLPKTWDLASETPPQTLYVEGIAENGSEGDATLELAYDRKPGMCVKDKAKMAVARPDLEIQNLPEETEPGDNEEKPGGVVCLNEDDDDKNKVPDKDQTGTVKDENDLVPLKIALTLMRNQGALKLEAVAGAGKVKVWETKEKGAQVMLPKTWDLASAQPPAEVFVERVQAGGETADVTLRLTYSDGQISPSDMVNIGGQGIGFDVEGFVAQVPSTTGRVIEQPIPNKDESLEIRNRGLLVSKTTKVTIHVCAPEKEKDKEAKRWTVGFNQVVTAIDRHFDYMTFRLRRLFIVGPPVADVPKNDPHHFFYTKQFQKDGDSVVLDQQSEPRAQPNFGFVDFPISTAKWIVDGEGATFSKQRTDFVFRLLAIRDDGEKVFLRHFVWISDGEIIFDATKPIGSRTITANFNSSGIPGGIQPGKGPGDLKLDGPFANDTKNQQEVREPLPSR